MSIHQTWEQCETLSAHPFAIRRRRNVTSDAHNKAVPDKDVARAKKAVSIEHANIIE
jgi:hypothetical protein